MDRRASLRTVSAVTLLVAASLILLAAGGVAAKSYDHPEIRQTFRLLPNGDAEVEDLRTFRFEGDFTWAELRLRTAGQYGTYDVEYLEVRDAATGQPLRIERFTEGGERVLRWHYTARDETRRFLLRYRIRRAVQRYGDVAQFYWKAIEDDHAPIARVHITVVPPDASPGLFKVFVHSRAAPGTLEIAPDLRRAVVQQAQIPETSFVELRVLLDPALFPGARIQSGQSHESLLADERRQASRELREGRLLALGVGVAALLILGLIGGYIWTYLRYGREHPVLYDADYEREPPRPLPPAVLPAILPQGGVRQAALPQAFAATLLEAARLGYLEIEERQDEGLLGTGLFRDTDLIYRVTARGQQLLQDGASGARSDAAEPWGDLPARDRPLEPFEVEVLRTVFFEAGAQGVATSDQIEAWGKKITGTKSNFLRFVERWGPKLRSWFEHQYFRLDDKKSERAKTTFIVIAVMVTVVAAFVGVGISLLFALPVTIVLIVLAARSLSRRTPEAALEFRRWEAFRRFLTDFSALKDAGPRVLHLWESYLVYAMALGVAEELLRHLQLVARELGQPVQTPRWYHPASRGAGLGPDGLGFRSLENLTRSFQNFQSLSRALSSSSRSGGGFSSGGGGGGGGGSSRAG